MWHFIISYYFIMAIIYYVMSTDNYRTQWMLACSGLMVIAVVFFGLSFIILCIYFLKKSYKGKDKNLLHASQAMSICGCKWRFSNEVQHNIQFKFCSQNIEINWPFYIFLTYEVSLRSRKKSKR